MGNVAKSGFLFFASIVLSLTGAGAPSPSVEKQETITTEIMIPSESGPLKAVAYRSTYRVRWESNEITRLAGLFLAVPSKGLYWIGNPVDRHQYEGKLVDRKFFLFKDKIVAASTTGILMSFRISAEPLAYSNLAETAVKTVDARMQQNPRAFDSHAFTFSVEDILDAVEPFGMADPIRGCPSPEISQIVVGNDEFSITLRGEKNDIESTITFGHDFRQISATLKGKQVYPKQASPSPVH